MSAANHDAGNHDTGTKASYGQAEETLTTLLGCGDAASPH